MTRESTPSLEAAKVAWDSLGVDPDQLAFRGETIVAPAEPGAEAGHTLPPVLTPIPPADRPQLVLGDTLGEGGMGKVRVARQAALSRDVAVKTLHATAAPAHTRQLLREARVTGWLEHPNIVPVHMLGSDADGRPVLVMKRIEGRSWLEVLSEAAAGERSSEAYLRRHLEILSRVTAALEFAHARGILHRDVKPENVMLGTFGEVYLVDWGIAVTLGDDAPAGVPRARDITRIEGTPHYLAPEMVQGDGARIDARSDVFLLGATLHHVLTGRPPHEAPTIEAALLRALAGLSADYGAEVPAELGAIARRAMAHDAGQRFPSAAAFGRALSAHLTHRASIQLCEEGVRRAAELAEGADEDTVQEAFLEARFAFEQALREWPENEVARRERLALVERMARIELGRGAPQAALTLLRRHPEADEALRAEVDAAVRERAAKDRRLSELERDHDRRFGIVARSRRMIVGGLLTAVAAVGSGVANRAGVVDIGHWEFAALGVVLLGVNLGWALVRRQQILATENNRRVVFSTALAVGMGTLVWCVLGAFGLSMASSLLVVVLFTGSVFATNVQLMGATWIPLPSSHAVVALAIWAWPEYALELFGLVGVGAILTGVLTRVVER